MIYRKIENIPLSLYLSVVWQNNCSSNMIVRNSHQVVQKKDLPICLALSIRRILPHRTSNAALYTSLSFCTTLFLHFSVKFHHKNIHFSSFSPSFINNEREKQPLQIKPQPKSPPLFANRPLPNPIFRIHSLVSTLLQAVIIRLSSHDNCITTAW